MTQDADTPVEPDWSDEESDLDRLYRQALEAVDSIEQSIEGALEEAASQGEEGVAPASKDVGHHPPVTDKPAAGNELPAPGGVPGSDVVALPARATPRQVIEALLFVGGKPLTSKVLVPLLREEFTREFIEETIDALNRQYAEEGRPYEIRLTEGGWLLALRPEFERVRHRVYGLGPKEVKLSQEVLEVLAVVAYHQPVSVEDVAALGKPGANGVLRQLLRRELIAIERGEGGRKDVRYRTTRRFLDLFNLDDLEDLPRAEEMAFK